MSFIKFFIILALSFDAYASCQNAYKAYKRTTLVSPITAPSISSTYMARGTVSTSGNLTAGAARTDLGLTTAGSANGLAFTYEGGFYLELMSSNLRHYRGRSQVLKILNQAELGMGEELENFLDDFNESLEDEDLDLLSFVELINDGNQKDIYCPKFKELFNLKNLRNYLLLNL